MKTIIEGFWVAKQEQGKLFVVSGPSGVGKTTVVTEFLRQYGQECNISRVVTYTTKTPRSTEVDGVDYHFIHQTEFERKIKDDFFLEWSGEYGACYGTPALIVEKIAQGYSYILIIDRLGAAQILQKHPAVVLIWMQVSSMIMLAERLKSRKTDSLEQIQTRLFLAEKEIEQELHVPMYDYHIDNIDLKSAVQGLYGVIGPRTFCVKKDIK